ncbi:MAG: hypothetical protein V1910_00565 [bacterium]
MDFFKKKDEKEEIKKYPPSILVINKSRIGHRKVFSGKKHKSKQ